MLVIVRTSHAVSEGVHNVCTMCAHATMRATMCATMCVRATRYHANWHRSSQETSHGMQLVACLGRATVTPLDYVYLWSAHVRVKLASKFRACVDNGNMLQQGSRRSLWQVSGSAEAFMQFQIDCHMCTRNLYSRSSQQTFYGINGWRVPEERRSKTLAGQTAHKVASNA